MTLEENVREHESQILRHDSKCYRPCCRRCDSESGFVRHAIRRRQFRAVEDGVVHVMHSWIVRWKCTRCMYTFTDYPPFALPDKQFVKSSVFGLSASYCDSRCTSYRSQKRGENGREEPRPGMQLAASTLWRWMNWLSEKWQLAGQVIEMIWHENPFSTVHRFVGAVDPCKYRSKAREDVLCAARRSVRRFLRFEAELWTATSPVPQQAVD